MKWKNKLDYGLPAFSLAVVGIPVYVHIPKFYSDVIRIDIAWVGSLLLAVRLFDALSDPLLGIVSDRTRSPMGRRRPYIAAGGIGLAVTLGMLFMPPAMGHQAATWWFSVTLFLVFLFWTVVTVPYEALGPEICPDYTERTSLFAVRDGLLIAGTLVAAATPVIIDAALGGVATTVAGQRLKFTWMAVLYCPLVLGTILWCVRQVREQYDRRVPRPPMTRTDLRGVLRNRPFWILLVAYTISAVGSNLPATLILYYVEYVLESPHANLFLLIYFAAGIGMLPAWIRIARRVGKKAAWLGAMALNTCAFSLVYFLEAGDELAYGVLVAISGLGFGATLALPSSIQADVIDYDEYLTGKRQEGWYIGIWAVVKKLSAAVGVGAGLAILGAVGYEAGASQSPQVVHALKILYAVVPSLSNLIALGVALAYPLSQEAHRKILRHIRTPVRS